MKLSEQEYQKLEEFVKMSFDFARNNDVDSLQIMLDNGLNPNIANHKGDTLLMLASYHDSRDVVKLLLEKNADIDKPNDRGHTPLAGVCFKGYFEVAKLLLEAGANPNGGNGLLSPINTALMFRRKEILKLLLSYNKKKLNFWQKIMKIF
ncbi:ankyrin repeat domain-containing protein [Helicobacter didelphidarum]|uniref:Ankyrin repeat domain-containing protein n=1 Tax=Helicobacter didelphidarum TaxID=2040648 RepID=A0A3D8INZ4_9HELI|nr:ankyrin repeat domain-containing protein [Helicobacter didelphidarum]RDU67017.1 ankyrin repeat domain-containing protein [Helicobacter didelphidarum]